MSGVDSIDKYSQMMRWLTRPKSKVQEPRNMDLADGGQLVAPSVDGSRPGYQGKDYIPGYNIKERMINEKKYQKVLNEMLDDMDLLKEKGYGNLSSLVEKYSNKLGPTKEKTTRYYKADGTSGGFNWNKEQTKIRGAVIDAAKQADVADLTDNMIKAVEDYKKFKGAPDRGETVKIIKANKVPESSFYKALKKVNAFVKQKKKWKNVDERKKTIAAERRAALKKYSSDSFERMTKGSLTIQGGHTGDIYNEFVTPKTKKYTPAFINQETLKEYDALIKSTGEARDRAIKAKNWKEVERLNTKGMNISAASEGYKTFKVVQPDGSSYIYGIKDATTTDPADLTKVDTVQELTKGKDVEFEKAKKLYKAKKISKAELEAAREAAEKRLLEAGTHRDLIKVQKKGAMKAAKLSKKEISALDKRLTEKLDNLKNKNFSNTFSNTFKDLGPRSVAQLAKTHGCKTFSEGGSIIGCLKKKFNADPEKFLQKSAPLAKDNVNLLKWFKNGRKIARGTGIALAWEAAFAPIIAGWGALEGQSGERILNDIAYGIPFIGETEKEEWMKYAGGNELAYKMKQMGELEEQELPYLDQQLEEIRKQNAPTREKMPKYVSPKEQYVLDDIKEKESKLQGLYNTPEFWEGPAGAYYNEPAIKKAYDLEQKTTAQIAADTAERKKNAFDKLREMKIIADKNWQSQSSYAGGGIASLKKKW